MFVEVMVVKLARSANMIVFYKCDIYLPMDV